MAPLLDFVGTVRGLFRGETTVLEHDDDNEEDEGNKKTNNLTAALAFLHSRGPSNDFELKPQALRQLCRNRRVVQLLRRG